MGLNAHVGVVQSSYYFSSHSVGDSTEDGGKYHEEVCAVFEESVDEEDMQVAVAE